MSNWCQILNFLLILLFKVGIIYIKERGVRKVLYPSIDKLLNIVDSKYKLVHVASIRSKQMLETKHFQMKETEYKNKRELGRALEEVEASLIKIVEEH